MSVITITRGLATNGSGCEALGGASAAATATAPASDTIPASIVLAMLPGRPMFERLFRSR
jgi:hypothetical protein